MSQILDPTTTKNFALKVSHLAKLAELEDRTGKGASELMRIALDHLYNHVDELIPAPLTEPDAKAQAVAEAARSVNRKGRH